MKALILGAGKGTRLGYLTQDIPKVMVPINSIPCILYAIENLKKFNILDIAINTHHLPDKIKDYFGDGSNYGVKIKYSFETELLGSSGALNNFRDFFNETFLVYYGDVIAYFDIGNLIKVHKKNNSKFTLVVDKKRDPYKKGIIQFNKENKVINFIEKPDVLPSGEIAINSGLYIIEPEILKEIPNGFNDFGNDLIPKLFKKIPIYCMVHEGYLFDIGTLEDLKKAQEFFQNPHSGY